MIERGQIRIYACGGAGSNIAASLEKYRNSEETETASLDICYIDTSKSNLARNKHNVQESSTYLIDGLDGSGKIRSENYDAIVQHSKNIIQEFKPLDLNIVISSGSGGSGSVLSPTLVGELLDKKVPVIVLLVGSKATKLDALNTIKTIKSFESISKLKKAPVVAVYAENNDKTPRAEVDQSMLFSVLSLAILYSRQNHELDSQDLYNWLRYDRVTSFPPQLSALYIVDGRQSIPELGDLGHVVSVATIGKDPDHCILDFTPDYQCTGFIPETANKSILERCPFNFIVTDGVFPAAHDRLNKFVAGLEEEASARIVNRSILSHDDDATEIGIVL